MKYTDIQKKSSGELTELIITSREALRTERFKDKFSKKATVIRSSKNAIAQALTEMNARRRNQVVK